METTRAEDTPAARSASDAASAPTPAATTGDSTRWIWPSEALFSTPSRTHSRPVDWRQESYDRCLGIHWLTRVGMNLKQPQISIATAAVYFHRFYMRRPLQEYDWKAISATALFLAIKVEEVPRKLELLVREYLILQGTTHEDDGGPAIHSTQEFADLHQKVLFYEDVLLRALAFDLKVEHPYGSMIRTIRFLHHPHVHSQDGRSRPGSPTPSDSSTPRYKATRDLAKALSGHAWGFINDSLSTPLCVIRTPQTIGAAAYLLALKQTRKRVPDEYGDDGEDPSTSRASARAYDANATLDGRPNGAESAKRKAADLDDEDPAEAIGAKDFATGAAGGVIDVAQSELKYEDTVHLPPGLIGRTLGVGERMTWWEAFGATSLKEVDEAANIMLDQYARSAAQDIRDHANSIQRPPHPSPLHQEPFTTTWTSKKIDKPPSPGPALPTELARTPVIVPARHEPSMYSPRMHKRASPMPPAPSPMGGGDAKRPRVELTNGHLTSSPAPRYDRHNLPSPFLNEREARVEAAERAEPRRPAASSRRADGSQRTPVVAPPDPAGALGPASAPIPDRGAAGAPNPNGRGSGVDETVREGEAMKQQEEALRVEEENRREEARLADLQEERRGPSPRTDQPASAGGLAGWDK